jgi:Spy/CpxP family protein refolding chaperone
MKRPSKILAAAAALVLIAGAASADRDGRRGHRFGRHGPPPIDRILERHAERLGLSDEVQERVRELAAEAEQQAEPLRAAKQKERDALHALLAEDEPDADAVMRQAEAVGAAETEMHKQRLRTLLAVRALLTSEQRKELVKIFEEKRARMEREDEPSPDAPESPEAR